jgi:hypothetical protein
VVALLIVGGCARMSAALGQQWIVVQFKSNTTMATARHVTGACSHLPNLRLLPIQPASPHADIVGSARYNATNASDADMARLQECLQRFSSVQGIDISQPGDN